MPNQVFPLRGLFWFFALFSIGWPVFLSICRCSLPILKSNLMHILDIPANHLWILFMVVFVETSILMQSDSSLVFDLMFGSCFRGNPHWGPQNYYSIFSSVDFRILSFNLDLYSSGNHLCSRDSALFFPLFIESVFHFLDGLFFSSWYVGSTLTFITFI